MVTRSTHHAHTLYTDGKSTAREMIESALSRGFVSIGFSEHARQDYDLQYVLSLQGEADYVREILTLKEEYKGRIAVHLGLEADEYGYVGDQPYEYVIGAKHYLMLEDGLHSVDDVFEDARSTVNRYFGGDWVRLCKMYFDDLAGYIERLKPLVAAHFDLPTKYNEGGVCFDENRKDYLYAGYEALARIRDAGALIEVNTGAIGRGYRTTPYPNPKFLKRWKELGGQVILGSDCHYAGWIDAGYDDAEEIMRQAGFTCALRLGQNALLEEYPL